MTQRERDRLVALQKTRKRLITQKQAAEELGISERQVRRLLRKLRQCGDRAVIHGLRGRRSQRTFAAAAEQQAVRILSREVYQGFGPTLASEYLRNKHGLAVNRETVRQWMMGLGVDAKRRKYFSVGLPGTGLSYRTFFGRPVTTQTLRKVGYALIAVLSLGGRMPRAAHH
jgi:biotin operon repressor